MKLSPEEVPVRNYDGTGVIGMMMAAKHPGSRPRTANVLREQVVRSDFRRVAETARPSETDRNIPKLLQDLLERLDEAEKNWKKSR